MEGTLLERTMALLKHRGRELRLEDVAKGAGVDVSWLSKFAQGRIPDPSVRRVQAVHDFLLSKPEVVARCLDACA